MYIAKNENEHELHIPLWMIAELRDAGAYRTYKADDTGKLVIADNDDLHTAIMLFGGAVIVLPSSSYIELTDTHLAVCWPRAPKTPKPA
ncbi:hypothetical protein LCGC14_3039360 [marine sediment metagenome]|uniref:Uncharacterized protein n=1 Tax=marine sediment metagenome TaxID=412755 RepID=A0A0F8ZG18_9ZZZZ